jgi:hypothetical protein
LRPVDRWSHELVEGDGQVADPLTGGVEDRVGDGRGGAGRADLAQADQPQWHRLVRLVEPRDIDRRDVGLDGHVVESRPALIVRPLRGSTRVCSDRAMPMPITMPPRNWLAAVLGLMTLPTSNTPSHREIRTSPVSVSTRTSQNCAPRAAFDQRPSRRNLDITRAGRASLPRRPSEPTVASTAGSPAAANVSAGLRLTVWVRRARGPACA